MQKAGQYSRRGSVCLLEDLDQEDDIASLIRTTRGVSRSTPRNSEHRRRSHTEDGYDELDFA
ncbi:hypothetical protein [Bradyrhizobium sp. SZCCHNRI2010]|uniref:hypothetical protein n=1 Tax=Bradyrhizobium sp. SZCCHNRI2010 TaxID=3057283 RepID=UPI0028E71E45|nr:hypothetical protein [Bradyrhizobium sp. SZCCHNRI2010]